MKGKKKMMGKSVSYGVFFGQLGQRAGSIGGRTWQVLGFITSIQWRKYGMVHALSPSIGMLFSFPIQ